MKQKTKNGKPRGASFADVLAHKRQMRAAVEKAAADKMVEVRSEIAVQRILWLAVASIADAYGFGAKRLWQMLAVLYAAGMLAVFADWLAGLERKGGKRRDMV